MRQGEQPLLALMFGVASMWGNGQHGSSNMNSTVRGGAGSGTSTSSASISTSGIFRAMSFGTQGYSSAGVNASSPTTETAMLLGQPICSIDMIGTGPGGMAAGGVARNGGGGGATMGGSFPGGGSGSGSSSWINVGGDGLLIVEY
mgnify:FL=1